MKNVYFLFLFLLSLLTVESLFAQSKETLDSDKDPNLDQLPSWLLNNPPINPPIEAVITVNGWDNFNLGTASAEPHFSLNPSNIKQMMGAYNTNSAYRTNDAISWVAGTPPFGFSMWGDPVTAYDSIGNLYYQNMYGSSTIQGAKVIKSTDNGVTWSAAVTGVMGNDKNWIACDQTSGPYANYVYCTMTNSGSGAFWRSTNQGTSFQSTYSFSTQSLPGMMVAVGPKTGSPDVPGGVVYVVTHSGTNAAGTYTFYASTDGGASFTLKSANQFSNVIGTEISGRSTVQGMRTRPYPMIAADNSYGPYRGRLYLVYASNKPVGSGGKSDIFSRYSTDQGATWSQPVTVNDDPNTQNNFQFFPAIWCDKVSGKLFVKWYDTRRIPTSDSMDVYATYSDDGGVTFKPNVRVTNSSFKIWLGGTAPKYQGDYDAMMTYGDQGGILYTDFRSMGYGSYFTFFPDYAMTVSPGTANIANDYDSAMVTAAVPEVKLYDKSVTFTASVTPQPTQGQFDISFLNGKNTITTFPDSVVVVVKTSGGVTIQPYTLKIRGEGPNGIPVHERTMTLSLSQYIPVELISFSAAVSEDAIRLDWSTATETNNRGYYVERSDKAAQWTTVGFVEGKGTTSEQAHYTFHDRTAISAGSYTYRLRQIDFDGTVNYSAEVLVNVLKPVSFTLQQNYPNPFNPTTVIRFALPIAGRVKLTIFDAIGNKVETLVDGYKDAQEYEVRWNAANVAAGAYFYSLELSPNDGSAMKKSVKKLMLMK